MTFPKKVRGKKGIYECLGMAINMAGTAEQGDAFVVLRNDAGQMFLKREWEFREQFKEER